MTCRLFGDARRPALCDAFAAERDICGTGREQALAILTLLELSSLPEETIQGDVK
jgi:hypothetical protein